MDSLVLLTHYCVVERTSGPSLLGNQHVIRLNASSTMNWHNNFSAPEAPNATFTLHRNFDSEVYVNYSSAECRGSIGGCHRCRRLCFAKLLHTLLHTHAAEVNFCCYSKRTYHWVTPSWFVRFQTTTTLCHTNVHFPWTYFLPNSSRYSQQSALRSLQLSICVI